MAYVLEQNKKVVAVGNHSAKSGLIAPMKPRELTMEEEIACWEALSLEALINFERSLT